jgi:hypothetical protein
MIVSKPASRRTLGSDLGRVDAHVIKPEEYEELPEMTDEMFARAVFKKAGRRKSVHPKQMISLRLPAEVVVISCNLARGTLGRTSSGLPAGLTPFTSNTLLARSMPTNTIAMDFPFRVS